MIKKILKASLFLFAFVLVGQGCNFGPGGGGPQTSGPAGMFMTTNDGEKWQQISNLITSQGVKKLDQVSVYRLFEDPQDPDALYWASRKNGLYYSYNGGQSWQHADGPVGSGFIYSVAVHPTDKCLIYATNGSSLYRSQDCSRSWEKVHQEDRPNARISSIAFHKSAPYELFMSKINGDLLMSPDNGNSWSVLKRFDNRIERILVDPTKKDLLYVASKENGIYRSEDRGRNWKSLRDTMKEYPGSVQYRRAELHPDTGRIYWSSKYGILVSDNRGSSWKDLGLITSPGSADIWAIEANPANQNEIYYTATVENRSTFYHTKDGGQSWSTKELPTGQIPTVLKAHSKNPDKLYAGFTDLSKQ